MLFMEAVFRAVCDRLERDKLQARNIARCNTNQATAIVSQRALCVAQKLQDKLQMKLPSVTAPLWLL